MSETIFFTVINPNNVQEETRLNIKINPEDKTFVINGVAIDSQQLAELGMLFFALACKNADLDSCVELLDGFNIPVPTKELKEIANNG